jgi:hypothetical protein
VSRFVAGVFAHEQGTENLEQLLDRIAAAAEDRDRVSVDRVLEVIGRRSYGPLFLIAGLATLAPSSATSRACRPSSVWSSSWRHCSC